MSDYVKIMNPDEIVQQSKEVNPGLLEVTGINPKTFASASMMPNGEDRVNEKLRSRPIKFGTYIFGNVEEDKSAMMAALGKGQ